MASGKERAVVIGGGLGGLSAASSLASRGFSVTLLEKNPRLGGKLNIMEKEGFTFDLGPSILTLPGIFRKVFQEAGMSFDSLCPVRELDLHWRNFFEDGTRFDFSADMERTAAELEGLRPGVSRVFRKYMEYAGKQDSIVRQGYFEKGPDTFFGMIRATGLLRILGLDLFRTMHGANTAFFGNSHLRDAFDYFIKYVGGSAIDAPGFMNMLSSVQWKDGLWYAEGGMYNIALAFEKLLETQGVEIRKNCLVRSIVVKEGKAAGVAVADGDPIEADVVVSNMEVIPAYRDLLGMEGPWLSALERKFHPACSGIVLHLGTDRVFPGLAHHNFFYSRNQAAHFHRITREELLPDDPTLYVVAVTRTDPGKAPEGCDNIKILPHIPPLNPERSYSRQDYEDLAVLCMTKMERMGITDLRKHVVVKDMWTPVDIRDNYFSNRGAIYGVSPDMRTNYAFKLPKHSRKVRDLWFVGGSVNPGGGMPMAVLSGYNAARCIAGEIREY
jgi:diapolycopene oxygenase